MKSQKGFTLVEVLLVIIAVALVGGVSYYVYDSQKDNKSPAPQTSQQKATTSDQQEKDLTADWKSYEGKDFSVKYPKDWLTMKYGENCPDNLGLGATEGSQGICQSDAGSQISISSSVAMSSFEPSPEYNDNIVESTATIDGVSARKYTFVSKGTEFAGFEDKGTKSVLLIFVKGDKQFIAQYNDGNGKYKDVLSDFDTMMTKTFKFK